MELEQMRHECREAVRIVLEAKRRRDINIAEVFGPRYDVQLHDHDTGTHLQIHVVNGEEKLLVWDYHSWKSSSYEFNNNGKVLGLQVNGPWAGDIDDILDDLVTKVHNSIAAEVDAKEAQERKALREHAEKVERFRVAFTAAES